MFDCLNFFTHCNLRLECPGLVEIQPTSIVEVVVYPKHECSDLINSPCTKVILLLVFQALLWRAQTLRLIEFYVRTDSRLWPNISILEINASCWRRLGLGRGQKNPEFHFWKLIPGFWHKTHPAPPAAKRFAPNPEIDPVTPIYPSALFKKVSQNNRWLP